MRRRQRPRADRARAAILRSTTGSTRGAGSAGAAARVERAPGRAGPAGIRNFLRPRSGTSLHTVSTRASPGRNDVRHVSTSRNYSSTSLVAHARETRLRRPPAPPINTSVERGSGSRGDGPRRRRRGAPAGVRANGPEGGRGRAETRALPPGEPMSQGRRGLEAARSSRRSRTPGEQAPPLRGGDAASRSLRCSEGRGAREVALAWARGRGRRNAAERRRGPVHTGSVSADEPGRLSSPAVVRAHPMRGSRGPRGRVRSLRERGSEVLRS